MVPATSPTHRRKPDSTGASDRLGDRSLPALSEAAQDRSEFEPRLVSGQLSPQGGKTRRLSCLIAPSLPIPMAEAVSAREKERDVAKNEHLALRSGIAPKPRISRVRRPRLCMGIPTNHR